MPGSSQSALMATTKRASSVCTDSASTPFTIEEYSCTPEQTRTCSETESDTATARVAHRIKPHTPPHTHTQRQSSASLVLRLQTVCNLHAQNMMPNADSFSISGSNCHKQLCFSNRTYSYILRESILRCTVRIATSAQLVSESMREGCGPSGGGDVWPKCTRRCSRSRAAAANREREAEARAKAQMQIRIGEEKRGEARRGEERGARINYPEERHEARRRIEWLETESRAEHELAACSTQNGAGARTRTRIRNVRRIDPRLRLRGCVEEVARSIWQLGRALKPHFRTWKRCAAVLMWHAI